MHWLNITFGCGGLGRGFLWVSHQHDISDIGHGSGVHVVGLENPGFELQSFLGSKHLWAFLGPEDIVPGDHLI